ncbi:MAG TPA: efflux RND transporter periplasmic adaptor subunit [Gammaproteobacteria bacterium]|nr:efflux RND transporter periplasmic adaptor subunit [Gammaproteobacteria bacterium]
MQFFIEHSIINGFSRRWLILLLASMVLFACNDKAGSQSGQRPQVSARVETGKVRYAPMETEQNLLGVLQAERRVRIFNQEPGRIVALPFYPGDKVKKGRLLIQLDDRLLQSELGKAQATLAQAQLDLQRITHLMPRKLASEEELTRARTAVELAQAEKALLETRHSYTRIRAPFDGVISERNFEPGDVAPLHSLILSMYAPQKLKIELSVSELVVGQMNRGDAVQVHIDALGSQSWAGQIQRIYPDIDAHTHKGRIEVHLQQPAAGARPGQLCRIKLTIPTRPRLVMPFAALRHDNQGQYVFRLDKTNKAHLIRIRSGLLSGKQIEILEGLHAGDRVVTRGFQGLRDNKTVSPVES